MRLNSTGLGKTTLVVEVVDFICEHVEGEGHVLQMKMRSTAPVSWQMSAQLDRNDLFDGLMAMLRFLWKPKNFFYVLKVLLRAGPKSAAKASQEEKKSNHSLAKG